MFVTADRGRGFVPVVFGYIVYYTAQGGSTMLILRVASSS